LKRPDETRGPGSSRSHGEPWDAKKKPRPLELADVLAELIAIRRLEAREEELHGRRADRLSVLIDRIRMSGLRVEDKRLLLDAGLNELRDALADAQRRAEIGASCIVMEPLSNDSCVVKIDEYPSLTLSRALGAMLQVLCAGDKDAASSMGHLVPWKTFGEISRRLGKKMGEAPLSLSAVRGLICRLRKALREGGGNRFFVQTNRRLGYRFALRLDGRLTVRRVPRSASHGETQKSSPGEG